MPSGLPADPLSGTIGGAISNRHCSLALLPFDVVRGSRGDPEFPLRADSLIRQGVTVVTPPSSRPDLGCGSQELSLYSQVLVTRQRAEQVELCLSQAAVTSRPRIPQRRRIRRSRLVDYGGGDGIPCRRLPRPLRSGLLCFHTLSASSFRSITAIEGGDLSWPLTA